MKLSYITLAMIAYSGVLMSQDLPLNEKGKYEFSEVINIDGATKEQIFRSSRNWMLEKFNKKTQDNNVIYTDDSFLGEMAAAPVMFIEIRSMGKTTVGGSVSYTITISAKEGKYKYAISEFYHESNRSLYCSGGALESALPDCEGEHMTETIWKEIKSNTKEKMELLITELKEYMQEATNNKEGNW